MTAHNFKTGDRVKYAREWLRSFAIYTGDIPFAVGTVKGFEKFGDRDQVLVRVVWDGDDHESRVLGVNLVRKADLHKERW